MRSTLLWTILALLLTAPAAADPCDTPPPACPARSAEPFDATGTERVAAGTARIFRMGDPISVCHSEGGCTKLVLHGQNACGLWLQVVHVGGLDDKPRRPAMMKVAPGADGTWEVVHEAMAFEGPDGTFDGKVRYGVRQVNAGCFEVTLKTALLPYPGE